MNVQRVPPQWQRLGFASEEDMNRHEEIYKRWKEKIDIWLDDGQAKKEKEK
ncbi:hypothetical protein ACIA4Q_02620 [Lactobacillus delbrueckii subsp. bulgaricus]